MKQNHINTPVDVGLFWRASCSTRFITTLLLLMLLLHVNFPTRSCWGWVILDLYVKLLDGENQQKSMWFFSSRCNSVVINQIKPKTPTSWFLS